MLDREITHYLLKVYSKGDSGYMSLIILIRMGFSSFGLRIGLTKYIKNSTIAWVAGKTPPGCRINYQGKALV